MVVLTGRATACGRLAACGQLAAACGRLADAKTGGRNDCHSYYLQTLLSEAATCCHSWTLPDSERAYD